MRAEHEKNDCGFFAFTMIRPPLDWIVSLYDDICHRRLRGHLDTCPQKVSGAVVHVRAGRMTRVGKRW